MRHVINYCPVTSTKTEVIVLDLWLQYSYGLEERMSNEGVFSSNLSLFPGSQWNKSHVALSGSLEPTDVLPSKPNLLLDDSLMRPNRNLRSAGSGRVG